MSGSISSINPASYPPVPKTDRNPTDSGSLNSSSGNTTPIVVTNSDSTTTTTITDPNGTVVSVNTTGTPVTGQGPTNASSSPALLDIKV